MKKLVILLIIVLLLPLALAQDPCETAQNPDLCYFVKAKETSDPSQCNKISSPALRSSCESQVGAPATTMPTAPTTKKTGGTSTLKIIIITLIILFVIGLIFGFYWMWHKAHITKTALVKKPQYPRLLSYVQRAKKQGMDKKQIKEQLKQQGWPDDIINQYL